MVKKFAALGIALLMCLSLAACNPTEEGEAYTLLENGSCCPTSEQSGSYWDNIVQSAKAYEKAIARFTRVNGKRTNDFGGVFIDENGLYNICVVGNRKPVSSDYLIYRQVENSYNFLFSVYESVSEVMQEYSVWQAGVCEQCNGVLICLEDESKIASLIKYLQKEKLFKKNVLNIYVGEIQNIAVFR